jgi:hypothetical protein
MLDYVYLPVQASINQRSSGPSEFIKVGLPFVSSQQVFVAIADDTVFCGNISAAVNQ